MLSPGCVINFSGSIFTYLKNEVVGLDHLFDSMILLGKWEESQSELQEVQIKL